MLFCRDTPTTVLFWIVGFARCCHFRRHCPHLVRRANARRAATQASLVSTIIRDEERQHGTRPREEGERKRRLVNEKRIQPFLLSVFRDPPLVHLLYIHSK